MEIDLKTVGDVVLYLGGLATALAAITYLVRRAVLTPLKAWIKEQVGRPLQEVHHEVTPNSGSSMKDDVTGVRETVDNLAKHLTSHIEATAPRDWRITALEMRMDQVQALVNDHLREHPGPTTSVEG